MAILCCWSSKALVAGHVIVVTILFLFMFTTNDELERLSVLADREIMTTSSFSLLYHLWCLNLEPYCRGRNNTCLMRIEPDRKRIASIRILNPIPMTPFRRFDRRKNSRRFTSLGCSSNFIREKQGRVLNIQVWFNY